MGKGISNKMLSAMISLFLIVLQLESEFSGGKFATNSTALDETVELMVLFCKIKLFAVAFFK